MWRKLLWILLLLLLIFGAPKVLGATDSVDPAKKKTPAVSLEDRKKAVLTESENLAHNEEYELAIARINDYISMDKSDPVGYWRKLVYWYFFLKRSRKDDTPKIVGIANCGRFGASYADLAALANTAISSADAKIAAGDAPDKHIFVKASALSVLAILQFKNESIWKSRNTMQESMRWARASRYQDAGFLLGYSYYRASKYPLIIRLLAGLPGDREKGKAMIFESVVQNNSPFVDDIWLVIFNVETDEDGRGRYAKTEVERVWRYLYTKYSRNKALVEWGQKNGLLK